MNVSLDQIIWGYGLGQASTAVPPVQGEPAVSPPAVVRPLGNDSSDAYCFAADFYAYLVLTLWAAAQRSGIAPPQASDFHPYFYVSTSLEHPDDAQMYDSTTILDRAMIGNNLRRCAMADDLCSTDTLKAIYVGDGRTEPRKYPATKPPPAATDVDWFNRARKAAGLP